MRGSSRVDPFIARAGFTVSGRLAAPIFAFRGLNRGFTRVTARAFVSRGFDPPITRRASPASLHVSQAFHMVSSSQFTREGETS